MEALPSGTVTFLFTDIEGSTRLWEQSPEPMRKALARHDALLEDALVTHHGVVFSRMGDGMAAAFASAPDAVAGACEAQMALSSEPFAETGPIRVRMGLHTGEGVVVGSQYANQPLNRCARLMAAAHGGQVLLSGATESLVRDGLPSGAELVDLGEHRLRDLARPIRVFQLALPGDPSAFPPLRSLESFPTNLPVQATSFIGRDDELASVLELVDRHRIVTLTGVGGVGKTRLALQAAAEMLPRFRDGAFVVELGAVVDPDVVPDVVAGVLGVTIGQGQSAADAVLGHLADRELVLVLDNCEHLLGAASAFADAVVRRCRDAIVLATSREPLGVSGEQVVLVPSLGIPADDAPLGVQASSDSVLLLVDRATMARADFTPSEQNTESLAHICRRLDGIPLALELAAARLRSMTPSEIASRLDQRFRLLTGGSRTVANRHQTLRRTIDWSYDLLDDAERHILQRTAVFAGGFDLAAAEAICTGELIDEFDVVDILGRLTEKSLVTASEMGDSTRYRMLETIRDYALERLEQDQDVSEVRDAHAAHYAAFAQAAGSGLRGREERTWLQRVRRELENLRLAVIWSLEAGRPDLALDLVAPLALEMLPTDHAVGGWAELVVAGPTPRSQPNFAEVAAFASYSAMRRGDLGLAAALRDEARRALPPGAESIGSLVRVLDAEWIVTMVLDGTEAWIAAGEHRVAAARSSGDDYELSRALAAYAVALASTGQDSRAIAHEAIVVAQRLGNPSALSSAHMALGQAVMPVDPVAALDALAEAERHARRGGNDALFAVVSGLRGYVLYAVGEESGALDTVLESLQSQLDQGYLSYAYGYFRLIVGALAAVHADEAAATLLGYWNVHQPASLGVFGADSTDSAAVADLPVRLGAERYEELVARGAGFTDAVEAFAYARSAIAALSEGRSETG